MLCGEETYGSASNHVSGLPRAALQIAMTSCYKVSSGTPFGEAVRLPWLPLSEALPDGSLVMLRPLDSSDIPSACVLLNHAIVVDRAWPFDEPLSHESFASYFCSHASFGVTSAQSPGTLLGIFYVKPNFPDRCDHVCNGGFVTTPTSRYRGVGRFMANSFFRAAKDLGYRSVVFNLVFANNPASLALWKSVGMSQIGTIPGVARMRRDGGANAKRTLSTTSPADGADEVFEYVDAYIMYRSLM